MCGILAIMDGDDAVRQLHAGLMTLQHRGQDAAGIVTYDGRFNLKKGNGLVRDVFNAKNLARLRGTTGLGHVRYPTVGGGGAEDAQPFYVNSPFGIALIHNGNLTNYGSLKEELFRRNFRHLDSTCDAEVILNVFADELLKEDLLDFSPQTVFRAVRRLCARIEGAYSVLGAIGGRGMLAFRDLHGIKPLIFGSSGQGWAFASESVALDVLGYDVERDVRPGEAIYVDAQGRFHSEQLFGPCPRHCIFEWVYFARPDSVIDGLSVYETRLRLGQELAKACREKEICADVVIPVPDTARAAALSLASALGVKFREGLIKNRYIGRTFIMPGDRLRRASVRQKLNPIRSEIAGMRVLLVDDSIVRGNTSREIISMVREAGAKAVYFGSYSPALRYPCVYGIDMSTRGEFIARDKTAAQIEREIGADRLVYQTIAGLEAGVAGGEERRGTFCMACFDGHYPTEVSKKVFATIERERSLAHTRPSPGPES
jgi:amidophosphoribosyltransferase